MTADNLERVTWLHLSDLHVGMEDQTWLWPTLKHSLFEDLESILPATGPLDLVIFSGDLTQRGSSEEFRLLDDVLAELWDRFRRHNFSPKLFVLPGNHDVQRANHITAPLRVLRNWWQQPEIHKEFFDGPSEYRSAILELFSPYLDWVQNGHQSIELLTGNTGLLPGDQACALTVGKRTLGIVGLNSTWLQLDGGLYEGKLHIDTKQLLAATKNDPHKFAKSHDLSLLITHHPTSWLHSDSKAYWDSDINPPGRFDLHLYGHMHEPTSASLASGGSPSRTSIQAASLFGMAFVGGTIERTHGYSIACTTFNQSRKEIRLWPRRLRKIMSGERKLGPDVAFDLDVNNSVIISATSIDETTASQSTDRLPTKVLNLASSNNAHLVLKKVRFALPSAPAHARVRRVEQNELLESLKEKRASWIAAEWGMGRDEFLSNVDGLRGIKERPAYRLDISGYSSRDEFLVAIRELLDCSFQQFCEFVSNVGDAYLLLDNFDAGTDANLERDVEDLVRVILEYCPKLVILVRTRRLPSSATLPTVALKALDEADVRTYLIDHESGNTDLASAANVRTLMRHTDGIPAQIDRALKDLEVTTLSELISSDANLTPITITTAQTNPALSAEIQHFATTADPAGQRIYALLKVLALFPQGEQLARIKRFYSTHPFHPVHATTLLERGLIEVNTLQGLDTGDGAQLAKTLVVPMPVREAVRAGLSRDEVVALNHRAAELYFGPQWSSGSYKFPAAYRFDSPHCGATDILNANTIVIRLLREVADGENSQLIARVLGLAESYANSLCEGNHYGNTASFCAELIPLIPDADDFVEKLAKLKLIQARCLRMTGEHDQSIIILREIEEFPFASSQKQNLFLNLAMCYESIKEPDAAKVAAHKAITIDRHSSFGLQARSLIIGLEPESEERTRKLIKMEKLCRRHNANVAANNIAILRARETDDPTKVREILAPVVRLDNRSDFYNKMRAALDLAQLAHDSGEQLSESELSYLIGAYHFLFNERMAGLFDRCHQSLWSSFDALDDLSNLLTLFRHSSLYWRLRGAEAKERRCLEKLDLRVRAHYSILNSSNNRELSYYKVRAGTLLKSDSENRANEDATAGVASTRDAETEHHRP